MQRPFTSQTKLILLCVSSVLVDELDKAAAVCRNRCVGDLEAVDILLDGFDAV